MFAKFSVKKPMTVFVAVILVLILGFVSFTSMTPDLLPNMEFPMAILVTTYPGASPEEVEMTVTKPLEQSMATLEDIENISSTSSENVSMIMLEFSQSANMDTLSADAREKISLIEGAWPDMVGTPYLMKINPNMLPIMIAAVDLDGADVYELTSFVNNTLMNKLEGTAGVASISTSGAIEKQINVLLSQEKLDKVNQELHDSMEKQFSEADEALKEAQDKLADGKNQLESGHKTLQTEMGKAESQVLSGKTMLDMADMGLTEAIEFTEEQIDQLTMDRLDLRKAIKHLDELEKKEAEFEAQIEAINQNEEMTLEEKIRAIAEITASEEYLAVQKELADFDAVLAEKEMDRESLREAYEANGEALGTAKETLAFLNDTYEEVEDGSMTLEEAIEEMYSQKSSAEIGIYSAMVQILNGESALTSAQQQLEDARSEAEKTNMADTLTMDMVSQILMAQNFSMPAGYITEDGVDYLVRVGDKIEDVDEMENLLLFDPGMEGMAPVYLKDVADIFVSDNAATTYARMGENDGLIMTFSKQSNYATAEVSENLQKRFEKLSQEYEGLHFTPLMDQGDYIYMIVNSVLSNLFSSAFLAVAILFLFLKDLKPTGIIAVSIPVSVVLAIVLMYFSGVTLNMISLSGLAVAIGMLVDNSVVVIENIYRLRAKGYSAVRAAVSGAAQVAAAITSSTLTTVCVFLPIVFVQGITRQLFTDLALTFGYALAASLIIALTVVPAMAQRTLRNQKEEKPSRWFEKLLAGYEKLLRWALPKRALVLILALVLLVGSTVAILSRGFSFMPVMDSSEISLSLQMPEESTLEETAAVSDEIIRRVSGIEGIETVGAMLSAGTSSMLGLDFGGGSENVTSVTMYVIPQEDADRSISELAEEIRTVCDGLEGRISVSSSNDMGSMLSAMSGSGVSIRLYGEDLDDMQSAAKEIASVLENVEGVASADPGLGEPTPEWRITVDKEKAMKNGLTVAQVYAEIAAMMTSETTSTTLNLENTDVSVVVIDGTAEELTLEQIKNHEFEPVNMAAGMGGGMSAGMASGMGDMSAMLPSDEEEADPAEEETEEEETEEEKPVLLKDIATITETQSLSSISRDAQRRYLTVSATVEKGHNVTLVTSAAQAAIAEMELPGGVSVEFAGENETIMESMLELSKMLLMAVAFIYLIMVAQFQSLKSPFIVLFTIPLAFTGGFLALLLCGMEISIISMIGFVMLAGVIVNNGIVLVDYVNQLRAEGMSKKDALIEAGVTRLRPILMTTLTTVLGMVTMIIGTDPGSQMMRPVAIVCIGGLLYATLMTLFVVPVMYDMTNREEFHVVRDEDLELIDE